MRKYNPKPLDTANIKLDPTLLELVEYLARNTHEVWAPGRIKEGWECGPRDLPKHHPGLVPYEELSEGEKEYDRNTALETLKLIVALGYKIHTPEFRVQPDAADAATADQVKALTLGELIHRWQTMGPGKCHGAPSVYLELGNRALSLGECLLGYDILKEGLHYHPSDAKLRQRHALAMARSGAAMPAVRILEQLRGEGHHDEETLGLLARCYKDLWEQSTDAAAGRDWLGKAAAIYDEAFRDKGGYWPAVNVATVAVLLGDSARSQKYAAISRDLCLAWLESAGESEDRYWALATLGEACLLMNDGPAAERYYSDAARRAGGRFGNISTTRRNARLILRNLGCSEEEVTGILRRCLALPRVVVFSGHRIDAPDRLTPRFPPRLESAVKGEIENAVKELDCAFGYASAACGSDILFLEAVLKRGGEANIVLPYEDTRFLEQCVAMPGSDWADRFRRLLASPGVRVITTSQGPVDDGLAHEYVNHFTFGLAGIRAWQLGADLATLAVWNGAGSDGPGGTSDAIARWRACGCQSTIIDCAKLLRDLDAQSPPTPVPATSPIAMEDSAPAAALTEPAAHSDLAIRPQMAAMVFADIAGYSKLIEAEIPLFIKNMLRPVAELASAKGRKPLHMSTWGDAFYVVFANAIQAGEFALDFRDLVEKTNWRAIGFRTPLTVRIALYLGPVHAYTNPTNGKPDFIGTHVNRAARMEPITPSGHVYASEIFAAIAFAERSEGFRCDYVGWVGLAKNFGTFPVYHVRRNRLEDEGGKA